MLLITSDIADSLDSAKLPKLLHTLYIHVEQRRPIICLCDAKLVHRKRLR